MTRSSEISIVCLLLYVFCTFCNGFEETKLYGVSHVAITVADLTKSTSFYTALGGMKVEKLSTTGIWGDALYYSMFQKQVLAASAANANIADYAVCDIKESGAHEVAWNFILFDDFLIKLIQCQRRGTDVAVNYSRQNYVGSSSPGSYSHMALWMHSEADCATFTQAVLKVQTDISSQYAGFQTGATPPATEAERLQQCQNDMDSCMLGFGPGTVFSSSRGVDGEKVEFACRNREATAAALVDWCTAGAIQKEMLQLSDRQETSASPTHKLVGMHHVEQTVTDRKVAKVFYEEVLGAKYETDAPYDGDVIYNLVYQDDIFEARSRNIPDNSEDYAKFGILKDWGQGTIKGHIDFYHMDNVLLETYNYLGTTPETNRMVNLAKPDAQNLSPGYVRSFVTGLWVYEDEDLDAYSAGLEMRALSAMPQVKTNRADGKTPSDPNNKPNSKPLTQENLEGYNFVYFNSPDGDTFALVQFKGKAKEALKEAMVSYGSISKAFDELNPQKSGKVNAFCCGRNVTATKDGSVQYCGAATRATYQLCVVVGLIGLFVQLF